jgi:hypothetical protein
MNADPTYRAAVAEKVTGVPQHSQRTWRKLGLLTTDGEESGWTEYALAELIAMAVTRDVGHRFGLKLEHAAEIGREAAKVGLGVRRVVGARYGDYPYVVVTQPGGEIRMRNLAGVEWDLMQSGAGVAIVVDAGLVAFGIVNNLRAAGEKIPAWWAGLEREYKSRSSGKKEPKP